MKKFFLLLPIIVWISCNSSIGEMDARKQTNEKLQVSGIFGIRNQLTQKITGHKIFDNIRITEWEDIPYDTITYHDIYKIQNTLSVYNVVDHTFAIVEAEFLYKEALKFGDLYSPKELNKMKTEWEYLVKKDSLSKAEQKRLQSLIENNIDKDKVAYLIYPFSVCATSTINNEDECYENGYSFVNVETNSVDTFLVLGVDLHLYSITDDYKKFLYELPLVKL